MEQKERILSFLTAAVILAESCLWAAVLVRGGSAVLGWLGLAGAAVLIGLLASLLSSFRRGAEQVEAAHRKALEDQAREHDRAMEQSIARNRSEMDAFRSSLSHTLRMPVAIIQGYAELLASGVVTDPAVAAEYLQKISQRSQFMTEAISRQFSSAEAIDSSKLSYSDLDLMALVRQAAADMQTAASNQGVTIQVVSTEPQIQMRADAYLLNRVLFNLLENALKYMGRPGVITIRLLRKGNNVSILVQDDGLGLSTEETAHIFESNYQGSNRVRGQGYGLYLVKRAMESHGGTVSAKSAPGRGMGISMELPLSPPQETNK